MTLRIDDYRITYGIIAISLIIAGMLFRNNAGKIKLLAMKKKKANVLGIFLSVIGWLLFASLILSHRGRGRGRDWYIPYLTAFAIISADLIDLIPDTKTVTKVKKYLPLVATTGWAYLAHLIVNSRSLKGGKQGLTYASALGSAFALLYMIPKQKSLAGPGPYLLNTSLGGLAFLNSL